MASAKSWIKAARPRTLPLALSGIIMGCGLAWFYDVLNILLSFLAIITATLIQIFSNFANDYGDSQKGTDNQHRLGPTRTMQSGEITKKEMKAGMVIIGSLSFILGVLMLYHASWQKSKIVFFGFLVLGILSLLAAYFYTAGKKSYGYIGLGDLAVFIFFGLLPVIGIFYLNSLTFQPEIILPAVSIGFFSTGVLNLNNIRDIENDKQSGKTTIPVMLGESKSRVYHFMLISFAWITTIIFIILQSTSYINWTFLLILPIFIIDLFNISRTKNLKELDPFLKKLALSTFAFTLLFCIGLILEKS